MEIYLFLSFCTGFTVGFAIMGFIAIDHKEKLIKFYTSKD